MATKRQAKANIFDALPPEMILRILDPMWPHDYSGFTCTCRRALELVNARWASEDYECSRYRDSTISLTGAWLRSVRERQKEYKAEMNNTSVCYSFNDDVDDPDL